MSKLHFCVISVTALALASCSSTPREFTANLKVPPADAAAFNQTHESCRIQVADGRRSGFGGQLASGAAGTAAAVGAGAVMVGGSTGFAAAAAAYAAVHVMPVVGIAAAWGLAKSKKGKKEREVKTAMASCLTENGYPDAEWRKASSKERKERRRADRARRAQ